MILQRTVLTSTTCTLRSRRISDMASPAVNHEDLQSFTEHLKKSTNILALCGAGLSAASGLPTFRGAGGLWRSYDATALATPGAFARNPGLIWQFYSYRKHMALQARPNAAHYALAELARRKKNFVTLTQNVDGLSPRAGHPASQIHYLHGSLMNVKCSSYCDYHESDNFTDPIVPALAIPKGIAQPAPLGTATSGDAATASLQEVMQGAQGGQLGPQELDISDDRVDIPKLSIDDLPHCPRCTDGLLRPGVVWFGETLPKDVMNEVDRFIDEADRIDLMLVIGTSSKVYPAAGYVNIAMQKGARVAVINMDENDIPGGSGQVRPGDWFFQGDAGVILPEILKGEIGDISGRYQE